MGTKSRSGEHNCVDRAVLFIGLLIAIVATPIIVIISYGLYLLTGISPFFFVMPVAYSMGYTCSLIHRCKTGKWDYDHHEVKPNYRTPKQILKDIDAEIEMQNRGGGR